ncbi:uncharacterized protein MONOS_16159 [Monocercomonoides exilis]|uniref:uncharacterized protein n=1 Tax=Monocercomonoides exilis TaxID=2049356 RepID=UPI00355A2E8A|nr:hypothetical protein MONOS_16159 [Monocercomonoides exilis]
MVLFATITFPPAVRQHLRNPPSPASVLHSSTTLLPLTSTFSQSVMFTRGSFPSIRVHSPSSTTKLPPLIHTIPPPPENERSNILVFVICTAPSLPFTIHMSVALLPAQLPPNAHSSTNSFPPSMRIICPTEDTPGRPNCRCSSISDTELSLITSTNPPFLPTSNNDPPAEDSPRIVTDCPFRSSNAFNVHESTM